MMRQVTTKFVPLGRCDYRVRIFLHESLKCAAKDTTCKDCASQAAFSLAVGLKTFFFIPHDEHLVDQYLMQSGHSSVELEERTRQIRENANPPTRTSRALTYYQDVWYKAVVDIYRTDGVLTLAEAHLRQEAQARGVVLGGGHILTREAKLQLSSILQDLGHLSEAARFLEQVQKSYTMLEIDNTMILRQLANLYADQGRWTQSEALLATVIARIEHDLEKLKGQVDQQIAMNEGLKQKYERKAEAKNIAEMEETLKKLRQECGERNILLLQVRMEMGSIYHEQGRFGLAVDTMRKVIEGFQEQLGPDHLTTISAMKSFARSLVMQGALLEALGTSVLVVARIGRLVGENHQLLLQSELLVAKTQSYLGYSEKPLIIFKSVIERQTKVLGISHLDTLVSEEELAQHHMDQQEYDSALSVQEGVVQKSETSLGARHPFTIQSRKLLGQILENTEQLDRAIELLSVAVEDSHEILGELHPKTLSARVELCSVLRLKGKLQEAEDACAKSLETLEHMYGKNHPVTLDALARLAAIWSDQDKQDEASELLRRAIVISDNTTGQDSHKTVNLLSMLAKTVTDVKELQELRSRIAGSERRKLESTKKATVSDGNQRAISLVSQRRWKEALEILTEVLPLSKEIFGQKDEMTMNILGNVAVCNIGLGDLRPAKETIEDVLRTLRESLPENSPAVLNQKANLASVLMRMGRLEEARFLNESLLMTMKMKYGETHPDTLRIMNNLAATNSRQDSTQSEAHALLYQITQALEKMAASDDAAA
jgi:tetratricopeptide (TPR) repeat protein